MRITETSVHNQYYYTTGILQLYVTMTCSNSKSEDPQVATDLSVSDLFKINQYEYFIITEITDSTATGVIRDGIYTVGDQYEAEFGLEEILNNVQTQSWEYKGVYSYLGDDVNGNTIQ